MRQFYKPAVMLVALLAVAPAASAQPTAKLDKITTFQDATHGLPSDATQGADGAFYAVSTFSPDSTVTFFRMKAADHTNAVAATLDLLQTNPAPSRLVLAPDGRLYGSYVADGGGGIFRFDPRTNAAAVVRQFLFDPDTFMPGPNGVFPGPLTVGRDGWLYGAMNLSSPDVDLFESGSLFRMDPVSGAFTTLLDFHGGPDGAYPYTALVEGADGVWYGNNLDFDTFCGNAFKFDTHTVALTPLHTFNVNAEGCSPGGFGVLPSGLLIGVTTSGNFDPSIPDSTTGGVFTIDPATGATAALHMFLNSDVYVPIVAGNVTVTPGGNAYVLVQDTTAGIASILRVNPLTGAVENIQDLLGPSPEIGALTIGSDARLYGIFAGMDFFGLGVLDPLPVAPAGGESGGMTTLSATLKALGIPLPLRVIAFTLNGNLVGYGITDANGVATLDKVSLAGIAVGTYPDAIGASFAGSVKFPASSGIGLLNIIGVVTPGQMVGDGFVAESLVRYDFKFVVQEKPNGVDRGKLELRISDVDDGRKKKVRRDDRFVSTSYTSVTFALDSVTNPQYDKATFAGTGKWNGVLGYRFEAVAQDRLAPGRHSESFKITIYGPLNQVIASVDGVVKGGKLESQRIQHR
jgi:hypothetical protein